VFTPSAVTGTSTVGNIYYDNHQQDQSTIIDSPSQLLERTIVVKCVNASATAVPSTLAAIDGYTPVVGDLVLLANITASALQGVYEVKAAGTAWTRSTLMNTVDEQMDRIIKVINGTTYKYSYWTCVTRGAITHGTTATKFQQTFLDATGTGLSISTAGVLSVASAPKLTTGRTIGTLTGDVTSAGSTFNGTVNNTNATTIAANAVTNAKLADMAVNTIKGRVTAGTGDPGDLSPAQVRTMITDASNRFITDTERTDWNSKATTAYVNSKVVNPVGVTQFRSPVANVTWQTGNHDNDKWAIDLGGIESPTTLPVIPMIGMSHWTTSVGYANNVTFGSYKYTQDWSDCGAYISCAGKVTGSDAQPNTFFKFQSDGNITVWGDGGRNNGAFWHSGNLPMVVGSDGYAKLLPTGTDLKTITQSGFYRVMDAVDAGVGWWYVTVNGHDASWCTQTLRAFGVGANATPHYKYWQRTKVNGTWNLWEEQNPTLDNWSADPIIRQRTTGCLSWNNYGNNHVIFDASRGVTPSDTTCNSNTAQIPWSSTYPCLMGWNGASTYGVRVDSAKVADSSVALTQQAIAWSQHISFMPSGYHVWEVNMYISGGSSDYIRIHVGSTNTKSWTRKTKVGDGAWGSLVSGSGTGVQEVSPSDIQPQYGGDIKIRIVQCDTKVIITSTWNRWGNSADITMNQQVIQIDGGSAGNLTTFAFTGSAGITSAAIRLFKTV